MPRGELYIADDEDLAGDFKRAQEILERYNRSSFGEQGLRDRLRRELIADCGDGVHVRPPFHLEMGRGSASGPDVLQLRLPDARRRAGHDRRRLSGRLARAVHHRHAPHRPRAAAHRLGIGKADRRGRQRLAERRGVIVCPGVTIGEDTVVGAGAVVTRDLPAGVAAMGMPTRIVREIGEQGRARPPSSGSSAAHRARDDAVDVGVVDDAVEVLGALLPRSPNRTRLTRSRARVRRVSAIASSEPAERAVVRHFRDDGPRLAGDRLVRPPARRGRAER